MSVTNTLPLRQAQKERTYEALCDAAIQLIAEEGFDAVTADRVAELAGVSRRTFFNYFPRVEMVLTARIDQIAAGAVAAFLERPKDEPLADSVRVVVGDWLDEHLFGQMLVIEKAAQTSPVARIYLFEFCESMADALEDALRQRLGSDADPVYVGALAAGTESVFSRMARLSLETEAFTSDGASVRHRERTLRAVELLFAGFPEGEGISHTPTILEAE